MAYFETKNLTFTYPQSSKKALDNVDLNIKQGEFVLIMGKSGSGKSTLLRLLKKEISPVGDISGDIDVNCEPIGFVGQNPETSLYAKMLGVSLHLRLKIKAFQMMKLL